MSFVGTRPEAVKYVKQYKPEYMAKTFLLEGLFVVWEKTGIRPEKFTDKMVDMIL